MALGANAWTRGGAWLMVAVTVTACVAGGWVVFGWSVEQVRQPNASDAPDIQDDPAAVYARAVQEGDCARVLAVTQWMQDRLQYVRSTSGDGDALETEKDALCEELQTRPVEGNLLASEGIEDKYVFPPGARIEVLRRDAGRQDLNTAVAHRTWLRVTYPVARYAPRYGDERAIQALDAGVNVSPEGLVVKAAVVGNLEVDRASLVVEPAASMGE